MNRHFLLGGIVFVLLALFIVLIYGSSTSVPIKHASTSEKQPESTEKKEVAKKPETPTNIADTSANPVPAMPAKDPRTRVEIQTSMGAIEAVLYDDLAPKTVKNFLDLANKGFYSNMIFHRVIPDFMIQTGDPTGTGRGGPGYQFADEFAMGLQFDRPGVLAMANSGPNTNGSQFFITTAPTVWLNGRHAIFGQVVKGMDIAYAISKVKRNTQDKPLEDVKFTGVKVLGQEGPASTESDVK